MNNEFLSFQIDQIFDEEFTSLLPERQLWCGVLLQALSDAAGKQTTSGRSLKFHQEQAREWFYEGNADFKAVCQLAGLDADTVQRIVIDRFLISPNEKRKRKQSGKSGKSGKRKQRVSLLAA